MKKIIIVLLLFVTPIKLLAQEFYIDLTIRMNTNYNDRRCESYARVVVEYEDASLGSEEIYYKDAGSIDEMKTLILLKGRVKKIFSYIHARDAKDQLVSDCCNCSNTTSIDKSKNKIITSDCERGSIPTVEDGNSQVNGKLEVFYSIRPIINIVNPIDNLIGFDDNFNVDVSPNSNGFRTAVYNWQYQVVSSGEPEENDWLDMPNNTGVHGSASFSIKPSSFLNIGDIGKRVYFRIRSCKRTCGVFSSRDCSITTSPVLYNLKPSAPHINILDRADSRCSKEDNGVAKVHLDRELENDEVFGLAMTLNGISTASHSGLTKDDFDTSNSFLLDSLVPGVYSVRIFNPNYYTGSSTHTTTFIINEPTPVKFLQEPIITNVWCNGGSDGKIVLTASGGVPDTELNAFYEYKIIDTNPTINGDLSEDWTRFSGDTTHTISGLPKDTYTIQIRDSNGCIAKKIERNGSGQIVGLGDEITKIIDITEPEAPVSIVFPEGGEKEPTAFGFSDGRITAKINGGTKNTSGNLYDFVWKYFDTETNTWVDWADFTYSYDNGTDDWYIILQNAKAGDYKLTVTDANHANATGATNTAGCTIIDAEFTLNEPPVLTLSLAETNPISCHNPNDFGDPFSDGELTATASGGVPFDPLIDGQYAYEYIWKKKNAAGNYIPIQGEVGNVLSNINEGEYAVNIIDANGITVGTASNNTITAVDVLLTVTQPELLKIELEKVDVFCNEGNDGSIDATITGGTGDYTIRWSTEEETEDIDTLVAGTYTIDVIDDAGCHAQASITINQPENPLAISYTFFEPTFTGATNGWIEATVTGGTPLDTGAYTYLWKDSNGTSLNSQVTQTINATSYVIKLNDLGKGFYYLTIEDKNHPLAINEVNCTVINSEYELREPEPLTAEIVPHTPISCNSANTYGDPFSDGAIEVKAEGGIKLQATDNKGLDYYYTWKEETSPGVWEVLTNQTSNIAMNLHAGNYSVNIEDANGIILGVYENNVLVNPTDVTFLFEEPPLLTLRIEKQDVYCYNGSDSWAKAIIEGGTLPYTILWSNDETDAQTSSLSQGLYTVEITDARGCQVSGSIQINQPTTPLSINYTAFATPSTGGAADGWIEAQIDGGTEANDGSYTYYWQDDTGNLLNAQTTTSIVNDKFQIRLNTIPKGSYYLTIEDANFPLATTGDGCTIIDDEFILYDPIEATISVQTPISCHQENVFNNPFSDGVLQVNVTGGLPFETGNPYIYTWKKENDNGDFDDLNQNSEIATGLSHGNYALNVADSRGVIIGVYESLNLITPTDALFLFEEPDLLKVTMSKTAISCGAGNDATATVEIEGGISPYKIQWSNGQDVPTATNLIAGNYLVYVTDARGCQATGNISIGQPGGLMIEAITEKAPTCFQGNDGKIELTLSGGTRPYTYSWDTGATTTSIANLAAGKYIFSLVDANGCRAFKEIVLEDPTENTIDLGADRTLCTAQTHLLDGSITDTDATYAWSSDNGFTATTPQITVSEAGTYQVTATSSLGCIATDTIVISYSNTEIDAEFLLSSQAYINQDVILFNVSDPLGETSEWILPENVTIIAQTDTAITLRFSEIDTYEIGLVSTQGDCYQETYKSIVVEEDSGLAGPGDAETPFIEEFTLSPNPNNGEFELFINLAEPSPIAIRVFTVQGSFVFKQPEVPTTEEYTLPINLNLPSGMYFVVLETAKQTQVKRMIVN